MLGRQLLGRHAPGVFQQRLVAREERLAERVAPRMDAQAEEIAKEVREVVEAQARDVEVQLVRPEERVGFAQRVAVPLLPGGAHHRLEFGRTLRPLGAGVVEVALELEAGRNVEDERDERRGFLPDDVQLGRRRLGAGEESVAHDGLAEGARRLGDGHAVAALAVRQVAHHPAVVGVAEFVGQGDHVARAAGIRHVDARRPGLAEARAVGAGPLARADRAFDPALLRHHVHEVAHFRRDGGVARSDQIDGFREGNRRTLVRVGRCRRPLIPRAVARLAVRPGLELRGPPRQRDALFGHGENGVQRLPTDAVHVRRRIQIVDRTLAAATPAHLQPPAGDGVDRRRAGLGVDIPGRVDGPPRPLALGIVGTEHQSARLGDAHFANLVAVGNAALERAGELVVEAAPGVDAVLPQARDQRLLIERQ